MKIRLNSPAAAAAAMVAHYDAARAAVQAERPGLFGKELDRKARKAALKAAGIDLPAGMTIAWATPEGWGAGRLGYRAQQAQGMLA